MNDYISKGYSSGMMKILKLERDGIYTMLWMY